MDSAEASKYLIAPIATSTEPSAEYLKQKEAYDLAIKALEERSQGEWEHIHTDFAKYYYKCSICGREINTYGNSLADYPFCHCGADMRKER